MSVSLCKGHRHPRSFSFVLWLRPIPSSWQSVIDPRKRIGVVFHNIIEVYMSTQNLSYSYVLMTNMMGEHQRLAGSSNMSSSSILVTNSASCCFVNCMGCGDCVIGCAFVWCQSNVELIKFLAIPNSFCDKCSWDISNLTNSNAAIKVLS